MTTPIFYPGVVIPVVSPIDDGLSTVSSTMPMQWDVETRISSTQSLQWDIVAYGITVTQASAFNTKTRIHKATGFQAIGLVRPVVYPIDYKPYTPEISWEVDRRFSVSQGFSWNVIARISTTKQNIHWNVYNYLFAHKSFSFNTLGAIYVPGFVFGSWFNQIDQPTIHPISYQSGQTSPKYEWETKLRISVQKEMRFGDAHRFSTYQPVAFNDLSLAVQCQKAVAFNDHQIIQKKLATSWSLKQRFYVRKAFSFEDTSSFQAGQAMHFRVFDKVTQTIASSWETRKRVSPKLESTFRLLGTQRTYLFSEFNSLQHVVVRKQELQSASPSFLTTGIVHPIDYKNRSGIPTISKGLCEPVAQPIDYSNQPGGGQIALPGFAFIVGLNPSGRVTCQKAIAFNDMIKVTNKQKTAWDLVQRFSYKLPIWFNVYNEVIKQQSTSWVIGPGTSSQIRQLAQVRTDFSY